MLRNQLAELVLLVEPRLDDLDLEVPVLLELLLDQVMQLVDCLDPSLLASVLPSLHDAQLLVRCRVST